MSQVGRIVNNKAAGTCAFHVLDILGFPAAWTYDSMSETFNSTDLPIPLPFNEVDFPFVITAINDFLSFVMTNWKPRRIVSVGEIEVKIILLDKQSIWEFHNRNVSPAKLLQIVYDRALKTITIMPGPGMTLNVPEFTLGMKTFVRWIAIITQNPGWLLLVPL